MSEVLGNGLYVFLVITLVLAGGAAWLMGQALGAKWRPVWQLVPYSLLLGFADRFIIYALFEGDLISPTGYLIDTAVIGLIALLALRVTRVRRMVNQYPWLYERAGPLAWRKRTHT